MVGAEKKEGTVLAATTRETVLASAGELSQMFFDYHDLVYRSAYRVTGNPTDAEDVLQTVFLRLARQRSLPDLGVSARGYFRRAAINTAIDLLRSRRSSRDVPLGEAEMYLEDNPGFSPENQVIASEVQGFLRNSIAGLKPRDAEIFVLSAFEGHGNKEIAAMFHLRQTTVGVILHRIRARLLNEMRTYFGGRL
jgi:RNA polymerase sigma-70 factor (ECF subfamily)